MDNKINLEKKGKTEIAKNLINKKDQEKEEKGCNCKQSKCLKLYCECFGKQNFCSKFCHCFNCLNKHGENLRDSAINIIKKKDPDTFGPKIKNDKYKNGCNCRKTQCMKKYCECFGNAILCSEICHCINCKNIVKIEKERLENEKIENGIVYFLFLLIYF